MGGPARLSVAILGGAAVALALLGCSVLGPAGGGTHCSLDERPAGLASLPLLVRPFEGKASGPVFNYFDHDLPAPADRSNGFQRTFCGSAFGGYVDGHTGYDWPMPIGTPLVAAASGIVEFAGQEPPFLCGALGIVSGLVVQIRHTSDKGAHVLVYAHLNELGVARGDLVTEGQRIGFSGNTGCSTEPHLHFEVWRSQAGGQLIVTDPYGWWPAEPDPWEQHPSGAAGIWLWKDGQAPSITPVPPL
jgi:murein DD-endopeptidase MepM/ murein hydrolase activator NlpD